MTTILGRGLSAERPFPGLRPFGFEDREFFFGREDQITSLYRLLDLSRFIAVIGSSGSGKSSLVRAGLLPLIDEEARGSGGRDWRWITMHPGDAPLSELAGALGSAIAKGEGDDAEREFEVRRNRIASALKRSSFGFAEALDEIPELKDKELLIVVDQFEELFRYARTTRAGDDRVGDSLWRDEASNFVQLLLEISRDRTRSVHVLITMRSDFIGDCSQFHGLPEAVSAAQFLTPSLTRDQREDVIRKPIAKAGATIEPMLVQRLLNDVSAELDQLPVLQHCLLRLWNAAGADAAAGQARHLTLEHYARVGRISGALSQHADEVMASLPGLEVAVEQVFRALSEVDKEGRATRRAITFAQLQAETGVAEADLRRVIDRFRAPDCSFLVPPPSAVPRLSPETRIDVGHEALLRRWDKISAVGSPDLGDGEAHVGWLAAEDADGRFYRALLALLETGGTSSKTKVTLPLGQVEERWAWWKSRPRTEGWAKRYGPNLPHGGLPRVEQLFTDSVAALKAERERVAEQQRREREAERKKIEAEEAAKRERLEHEADLARMRAEQQAAELRSAQAVTHRTRLLAAAMSFVALIALASGAFAWVQKQQADLLRNAAVDQQHKLQATLDDLKRATEAKRVAQVAMQKAIEGRAKAEKEKRIAAERAQRQAETLLRQAQIAESKARKAEDVAKENLVRAEIATAVANKRRAAIFLQAGRQAFLSGNNEDAAVYLTAAYNDDRGNAELQVLLGQTLQRFSIRAGAFQAHQGLITDLKFNPADKREIASASTDGTTKVWDNSGRLLHVFADQDVVTALAFDPSGQHLLTAARDGSLKLRDLRGMTLVSAREPVSWKGHLQRIKSVQFSRDGARVLTASSDGRIKVWKTSSGELLGDWDDAADAKAADPKLKEKVIPVNEAHFASNDRLIVSASSDGTLRVRDATGGTQSKAIHLSSPLVQLAVATRGPRVAAGAIDGTVLIYDLATGKQIERHDQRGVISALSFDPSGRRLVSASDDGTARVIDATTGEPISILNPQQGSTSATSSVVDAVVGPSGTIATTYADGSVDLWSLGGQIVAQFPAHQTEARTADFDAQGDLLATGSGDGKIALWRSANTVTSEAVAQKGAIESIAFDPSGRHLVSASRDGTAVVWRVGETLSEERVLPHSPGGAWVNSASFSADGKRIVTAGGSAIKIWNAAGAPNPVVAIKPTVGDKRFSDAQFIGAQNEIIGAQRRVAESDDSDRENEKWVVFSSDGRRKIADLYDYYMPEIRRLEVSRNGHFVLATSDGGYALFSLTKGRKTYNLWTSVAEAALANDHFFYALGSFDGTIDLRSFTGVKTRQFSGHRGRITALAFSGDDRWLGSAGKDDALGRIWDVATGALHATLSGSQAKIESLQFSPHGADFVLTTSTDGTARLWDRDNGDLFASIAIPGSHIHAADFTPDGDAVVLGATDGALYLWRIRAPIPAPQQAAKIVLAALGKSAAQNAASNLVLRQAEEETGRIAGSPAAMLTMMGGADRTNEGLQAASTGQPSRAAAALLPAYLASDSDPTLRLSAAVLATRFAALRETFKADSERVDHVAFAENGTKVVTGSFDRSARVWDVASGRLLHTLGGFKSLVHVVNPQRQGHLAIVAGLGDDEARVWDLDSGAERYRLRVGGALSRMDFSADGSRIAGFGSDGVVEIWNTSDGRRLREFHPRRVDQRIAWTQLSSDGHLIAIASNVATPPYLDKSGDVTLWDVASGKRLKLFDVAATDDASNDKTEHLRYAIAQMAMHPSLPLVLTTQRNVIRIWNRETGRLVRTLHYSGTMRWAGFAHRSDFVAATGDAGTVLWNSGRLEHTLRSMSSGSDGYGLFTQDDRRLFTVGANRGVSMWDPADGRLLAEFGGSDGDYLDADITADGKLLAIGGDNGLTHLWSTAAGSVRGRRFEHGSTVVDLQIDGAGTRLLTRGSDGGAKVWDVNSARPLWLRSPRSSGAQAQRVRLARGGGYVTILTRLNDRAPARFSLEVLGAADGRLLRRYEIDGDADQSPSARYVASIRAGRVAVLDTMTGRSARWATSGARVHFGASDDVLISEDADGKATVWRRDGGGLLTLAAGVTGADAALSPNGRRLLTFGRRIGATLWDISQSEPRAAAILYTGGGQAVAAEFDKTGAKILTLGADGSVRLWSAERGQSLTNFGGGATYVTRAHFSPDGSFVVGALEEGTLGVWDERGRGVLSFPTRTSQRVAPQSFGNLVLAGADGDAAMLYRIGATPSRATVRDLERRLGLEPPSAPKLAKSSK